MLVMSGQLMTLAGRRATKEIEEPEAFANHFCEIAGRLESFLRRNDLLKSFHTTKTQTGLT